jgi:hypothetical protein
MPNGRQESLQNATQKPERTNIGGREITPDLHINFRDRIRTEAYFFASTGFYRGRICANLIAMRTVVPSQDLARQDQVREHASRESVMRV